MKNIQEVQKLNHLIDLFQLESIIYYYVIDQNKMRELGYKLIKNTHSSFSGYDAALVQSNNTGDVVILHRGTNYIQDIFKAKMLDFVGLEIDVINDMQVIIANGLPIQVKDALKFVKEVQDEYKGVNITQLGHSLGGFLAQCCYLLAENPIDTYVVEGIGASEVLTAHYSGTEQMLRGSAKLEYYNRLPNAYNTHGVRICAKEAPLYIIPSSYSLQFGTGIKDYIEHTINGHNLDVIVSDLKTIDHLETFDNAWPSGIVAGFKWYLSDNNNAYWDYYVANKIFPVVCKKLNTTSDNKEELQKVQDFFDKKFFAEDTDKGFNWSFYLTDLTNVNDIADQYYATQLNRIHGTVEAINEPNIDPIHENIHESSLLSKVGDVLLPPVQYLGHGLWVVLKLPYTATKSVYSYFAKKPGIVPNVNPDFTETPNPIDDFGAKDTPGKDENLTAESIQRQSNNMEKKDDLDQTKTSIAANVNQDLTGASNSEEDLNQAKISVISEGGIKDFTESQLSKAISENSRDRSSVHSKSFV